MNIAGQRALSVFKAAAFGLVVFSFGTNKLGLTKNALCWTVAKAPELGVRVKIQEIQLVRKARRFAH